MRVSAKELLDAPIGRCVVGKVLALGREPVDLSEAVLVQWAIRCGLELSEWRADSGGRPRARSTGGLRNCAEALAACSAAAKWSEPLDRLHQVWIAPDPGKMSPARLNIDLGRFGGGIPKPKRALWTSTYIPNLVSPWIEWCRAGDDQRPGPYFPWLVEAAATSRVWELQSARDWADLVIAYPGETVNNYVLPDWRAVSNDWDCVHLSTTGFLIGHGVGIATELGVARLEGWNMESSLWLRWSFRRAERLEPVPS